MAMDAERDRLIGVATRLFAELGYDWTSMRMIADAAGVDPEQVTQAVGDKPELYQEVMARALRAEQEVVRSALRSATPGVQAALDLVDAYLDFNLAHPEYLSLWLHRWTGDAADTPDLEGLYSRPLAFEAAEAMQGLTPDGVCVVRLQRPVRRTVCGFMTVVVLSDALRRGRPRGGGVVPRHPEHAGPP